MKKKKWVYLVNRSTRTIRRYDMNDKEEKLRVRHFLLETIGGDPSYIRFNKWPKENRYFKVCGEW